MSMATWTRFLSCVLTSLLVLFHFELFQIIHAKSVYFKHSTFGFSSIGETATISFPNNESCINASISMICKEVVTTPINSTNKSITLLFTINYPTGSATYSHDIINTFHNILSDNDQATDCEEDQNECYWEDVTMFENFQLNHNGNNIFGVITSQTTDISHHFVSNNLTGYLEFECENTSEIITTTPLPTPLPTPSPHLPSLSPTMPTYYPSMPTPSPDYPTPSPEYPTPSPEYPTPSPQYPTPSPQYPTPSPEYPTPSPHYPTPSPEYPTPSPHYPSPSPTYYVDAYTTRDPSPSPTRSYTSTSSTTDPHIPTPSPFYEYITTNNPTKFPTKNPTLQGATPPPTSLPTSIPTTGSTYTVNTVPEDTGTMINGTNVNNTDDINATNTNINTVGESRSTSFMTSSVTKTETTKKGTTSFTLKTSETVSTSTVVVNTRDGGGEEEEVNESGNQNDDSLTVVLIIVVLILLVVITFLIFYVVKIKNKQKGKNLQREFRKGRVVPADSIADLGVINDNNVDPSNVHGKSLNIDRIASETNTLNGYGDPDNALENGGFEAEGAGPNTVVTGMKMGKAQVELISSVMNDNNGARVVDKQNNNEVNGHDHLKVKGEDNIDIGINGHIHHHPKASGSLQIEGDGRLGIGIGDEIDDRAIAVDNALAVHVATSNGLAVDTDAGENYGENINIGDVINVNGGDAAKNENEQNDGNNDDDDDIVGGIKIDKQDNMNFVEDVMMVEDVIMDDIIGHMETKGVD